MSQQPYHTQVRLDMLMRDMRLIMNEGYIMPNGGAKPNCFNKFIGPRVTQALKQAGPAALSDLSTATFALTKETGGRRQTTSTTCSAAIAAIQTAHIMALAVAMSGDDDVPQFEVDEDASGNPMTTALLEVDGDGCCMLYAISVGLVGDPCLWHYLRDALHAVMTGPGKEALFKSFPKEGELTKEQWADLVVRTTSRHDNTLDAMNSTTALMAASSERPFEGFHMYALCRILRRPILLVDDAHPMLFLPHDVPPPEWGPALVYTFTNKSMNHFAVLVPTVPIALPIPLDALANSEGKFNVCSNCVLEPDAMDREQLEALIGADHFMWNPSAPTSGLQSTLERTSAEAESEHPADLVVEAMVGLGFQNPFVASTLLGDALQEYVTRTVSTDVVFCMRCTAMLPRSARDSPVCAVCSGTQFQRVPISDVPKWVESRSATRWALRVILDVAHGGGSEKKVFHITHQSGADISTTARTLASLHALPPTMSAVYLQGPGGFATSLDATSWMPFPPEDPELVQAVKRAFDEATMGAVQTGTMKSAQYLWVSQDPRFGDWQPYDQQLEIEEAYQSGVSSYNLAIDYFYFILDFKNWRQKNERGGNRALRRIPGKWQCPTCTLVNSCENLGCVTCRTSLKISPETDPYLGPGGYYYNKVTKVKNRSVVLTVYEFMEIFHYDPNLDRLVRGGAKAWDCQQCGHENPMANDRKCEKCLTGTGDPYTDPRLVVQGVLYESAAVQPRNCVGCKLKRTPCTSLNYQFAAYDHKISFAFKSSKLCLMPVDIILSSVELSPGGAVYEHVLKKTRWSSRGQTAVHRG
eukprot:PhM_4_TR3444/c0_g1_i1/m.15654